MQSVRLSNIWNGNVVGVFVGLGFFFFLIKSARGIEPDVKMEGNKIFCQTYADGQ